MSLIKPVKRRGLKPNHYTYTACREPCVLQGFFVCRLYFLFPFFVANFIEKYYYMKKAIFLLFIVIAVGLVARAQPGSGYAQRAVERKMDSTYRKQGKKAVTDHTYENDTRYKDPNNKVLATLVFADSNFKKERLRTAMTQTMVFGKHGEAYVMYDNLKDREMQWFVFNYADKANYIVDPKQHTAMKMPLMNFNKMMERQAAQEQEREGNGGRTTVKETNDYATFAGYKARKYIITLSDGRRMDAWVSKGIKVNLKDDYMLGARLNQYRFPENTGYKNMEDGIVVRMVMYDKDNETIMTTRTMMSYTADADEKYFDLTGYKINDVLNGL